MFVNDSHFKITSDPLKLSNYILNEVNKKGNYLDIGSGNGIISLLISKHNKIDYIDAIEIQKDVYELLHKNIDINFLNEKIYPICLDVKILIKKYDVIFSNPPYYKIDSGELPQNKIVLNSKYESMLTLEQLFNIIKKNLKNNGEFVVIIPYTRLNESLKYIYENKMNIKKLSFLHSDVKKVIIHGIKGGKLFSHINVIVE